MNRNASIPEGCRKAQSLPMSSNDLEAQRAVVLSFRIQVGVVCDFQSNRYSLRIQELHQLLTYGGMSKSGNKPTLQVSLQSNLFQYSLCIQKRALEMVENSRDPNMSTKIQELSRQVSFIILMSQECYLFKMHIATTSGNLEAFSNA